MTARRLLVSCVVLLLTGVAWILYSEPHIRAYLCPACSGFRQMEPRIYVDRRATEADMDAALQSFAAADRMALDIYPDRASDPVWLLCLSGDCGAQSLPRPRAMAYLSLFVFVYPDGANPTILAHELAHTELHERVGSRGRVFSQAVPTWFDEGLAVVMSRDRRYLDVKDGVDVGCKAGDWPEPPSDQRRFRRLGASQAEALYSASACRVMDWMERHGGADAVVSMLDAIREGGTFRD